MGTANEYVLAVDQTNDNASIACTSRARLDLLTETCEPIISDKKDAVNNCYGYSNDSCLLCKSGFFMKFSHKKIQECKIADDLVFRKSGCAIFKNNFGDVDADFSGTIKCLKCYEGYLLDATSETCISIRDIYNCEEYNIADIADTKCSKCKVGYNITSEFACELKSNLLASEKVANCFLLEDEYNCAQCNTNYYLVGQFDYTIQKQSTLCVLIPLPENCEILNGDLLKNEGKVFCQKCLSGYAPEFFDQFEVTSSCQKFHEIENCLIQDGVTCLQCKFDYYFNTQKVCQKRNNLPNTCLTFSADKDECKVYFQEQSKSVDDSSVTAVKEVLFMGDLNAALIDVTKDLPVLRNFPPTEDPDKLIDYLGESNLENSQIIIS